jgi:2-dehydro-3-deoxyphosphooctonate aldolase (KDO 8-P synthase)
VGQPEFIETMARAAVAAGIDALFLEVHQDPKNAPSDGANMLPLEKFENLLVSLKQIHSVVQSHIMQT